MDTRKTLNGFIFFLIIVCGIFSCRVQKSIGKDTINSVDKPKITLQDRKQFIFNNGDLTFSNQFLSGRLNHIYQVNDSSFSIFIDPENRPVNPSPWYAFKVWSKKPRNVYITLDYHPNKHRYHPKISRDNISWENFEAITLNEEGTVSFFKLPVNKDTLTVAAQEIISSVASNKWADSLANLPFMKKQIIGQSLMGKPIVALNNTESDGKKIVIVISRQHPPEVTGYMAMQEFVESLTSSSELARKFRENYELIIVPMVNPDGVDEGNWRHNAAGVDLNRDWEFFVQPETRAVRDFILKKVTDQEAKVYFAFDFHSTWNDILYPNLDTLSNFPGLTRQWVNNFQEELGVKLKVSPSSDTRNLSKNWFLRELKADGIIYEVGDDTPRDLIKKKGEVAAEVMMKILVGMTP